MGLFPSISFDRSYLANTMVVNESLLYFDLDEYSILINQWMYDSEERHFSFDLKAHTSETPIVVSVFSKECKSKLISVVPHQFYKLLSLKPHRKMFILTLNSTLAIP